MQNRSHPTAEFAKRRLFFKCYDFAALRAVSMSPWKQCEARPQRGPRQDPAERSCWGEEEQRNERAGGEQPPQVIWSLRRRGLNRVNCTRRARRKSPWGKLVGPTHVSPPSPRMKSQNPKGGFGALWHAFLPYLSSCNERWGHRRSPDAERGQ